MPYLLLLLACNRDTDTDTVAPSPEPGPLVAGVATAPIPAPLGIGTAGFGPFGAPDSTTPFSSIYPGTVRMHGQPEIKVVALSRGEGFEVIFVRVDAVGVFQQLRRALVIELQERTGRDLNDALVLGATHTHSGPGRIIDGGGLFELIADTFFPEFYDRFVQDMADTVEAALADQRPARLGTVVTTCEEGHNDRRCDDGLDYTNSALPVIAVERDGQLDALVVSYAVHGTVLGIDDLTLSQDVSGAVEQAIEDRFDHPVEVLMLNAWAADMAPSDPVLTAPQAGAAGRPDGYDRMERVGSVMADAVHDALPGLAWEEEPALRASTRRVPLDREAIGYADGEFEYEHGAVYCEGESDCDPATTIPGLDAACLPFNEVTPAPNQTEMTAGQVGPFTLITFPGEPGTLLAEQIMDEARAAFPDQVQEVFFVGYAQDYVGYSILEEDWWQGGYEASGAIWGPRQGEYLASRAIDVLGAFLDDTAIPDEPAPIPPFDDPQYTPYVAEQPLDAGRIVVDLPATAGVDTVFRLTVNGGDPWLGPPRPTIERADGTVLTRPNGAPLGVGDYDWSLELTPSPSYDDAPGPTPRTFAWTLELPVQRTTPGWLALEDGEYRIRVEVPIGPSEVVEATSSAVVITRE